GTDDGLCAFDPEKERFRANKLKGESRIHYSQIAEVAWGGLWLPRLIAGFRRFDPKTGQFTQYWDTPQTQGGLTPVLGLCVDHAGIVWFGTRHELVRFHA